MDGIELPKLSESKYILTLLAYRGLKILVIALMVWGFIRLMKAVSRKIVEHAQDDDHSTQSEREKRAETLAQIVMFASEIFSITIGLFMVLREVGINITPLLTGAGIIGVALGLGAQSVARDFVNGFFILMENQYRVGDIIRVDGHEGLVEKVSLRTTLLRDVEGILHIIPNGEIKSVRNLTYGWSQVKLDIGLPYQTDVERALAVLRQVSEAARNDPALARSLIGAPEVLGIEELGESRLVIRLLAKTLPQRQMEVGRQLRMRIKEAFDANGIEIPAPQRVIISYPADRGRPTERRAPDGQKS